MSLWVFGYGSLLWDPGFEVAEQVVATLPGWRRSFCMSSIHHRGTPERPGLVLALDEAPEAKCNGLALRVKSGTEDKALAELRERELVSAAYLEKEINVILSDGRIQSTITYVVDPQHCQYVHLPLEEQANVIAKAVGGRGPNPEYLFNTAALLDGLGLKDAELDWLTARVKELIGE